MKSAGTDRLGNWPKLGVTRSFVNRLLRMTLLAPDIQEAILDGWQPKGMQLEELTRAMPSGWEAQRKAFLSGAA